MKRPLLLSTKRSKAFKSKIWDWYAHNRRSFPWRETKNHYQIVVSEIMLQQTQTERVNAKFRPFIRRFPNFKSLAEAPLHEVLSEWQGLGYNRRARFLRELAVAVVNNHAGKIPVDITTLRALPGIGSYTAGALQAFIFNIPAVFIETNIRTVFIHEFFKGKRTVNDKEILPLIEFTLSKESPREWYYALMDYGVYLKKKDPKINSKSAHYTRQSPFKGSLREVRGAIVRALSNGKKASVISISEKVSFPKLRVMQALKSLERDEIVTLSQGKAQIRL